MGMMGVDEFVEEPGFADARLAYNRNNLAAAATRVLGSLVHLLQLGVASDKPCKAARVRSLQPRPHRRCTEEFENLPWLRHSFDRDHSERLHVDEPFCQSDRLRSEAGHPRRRELLHSRREMGRLSHRRVVHSQVAANGADHDIAGVDADPDLNLDPMAAAHFLSVAVDQVLHSERGVAGANRMVLVRQRRSEQRHDAVAHDLIDRALIAMNRLHHVRKDWIDDLSRFLGITVGQQFHRTFDVGEQHRYVLALTFKRGLRADDLLGEIFRDVGFRHVEAW